MSITKYTNFEQIDSRKENKGNFLLKDDLLIVSKTEIEEAEVTLQKIKELIEVELGWMQPGRGYGAVGRGVPPSRYIKEDGVLNSPPPNALPPLFGLSEYDGISLEAIKKIIEAEYLADGSNAEKVLAKIKQYLETSVSIGSSYAGQFGDSKKKR